MFHMVDGIKSQVKYVIVNGVRKGMDILKSSVFFVRGNKADRAKLSFGLSHVCSGSARLLNENLRFQTFPGQKAPWTVVKPRSAW